MGRTLHWTITTPTPITDEQNAKLIKFSQKVNKEVNWTCENFWVEIKPPEYRLPNRPENKTSGFCKVGGNEANAFAVLTSLVFIHNVILPESEIKLSDEGDLLYAPIIIRDFKQYVDWERFNDIREYHKKHYPAGVEQDITNGEYLKSKMLPDGSFNLSDLHR